MITLTKTKVAAFKPGTFCDQSKTYKSSFFMSTIDNISSNDSACGRYENIWGKSVIEVHLKDKGFVPIDAEIWRGTCPPPCDGPATQS